MVLSIFHRTSYLTIACPHLLIPGYKAHTGLTLLHMLFLLAWGLGRYMFASGVSLRPRPRLNTRSNSPTYSSYRAGLQTFPMLPCPPTLHSYPLQRKKNTILLQNKSKQLINGPDVFSTLGSGRWDIFPSSLLFFLLFLPLLPKFFTGFSLLPTFPSLLRSRYLCRQRFSPEKRCVTTFPGCFSLVPKPFLSPPLDAR